MHGISFQTIHLYLLAALFGEPFTNSKDGDHDFNIGSYQSFWDALSVISTVQAMATTCLIM